MRGIRYKFSHERLVFMKTIRDLFAGYREQILYLIFGILTTVVDFAVYTPLTAMLGADYRFLGIPWYLITSVIAWVCAVLFAYLTNKAWVFDRKDFSARAIGRELPAFAGGRVLTLLIQLLLMWLMIDLTHLDRTALLTWGAGLIGQKGDFAVKAIVAVVVVILNYVFSKLFVFRNPSQTKEKRDNHDS